MSFDKATEERIVAQERLVAHDALAERVEVHTRRLEHLPTHGSDAGAAYAELMAIVIQMNAELATQDPAVFSAGTGTQLLERLKAFIAKLREKLGQIAEHLSCQSWSITAGWPAAATVTVTFSP
jgi:hypothetical protein